MITIFFVSHRPLPGNVAECPDWLLHGMCYGVLFLLAWIGITGNFIRMRPGHHLALAFFVSSIYGVLDEWHQSFIPSRQASLKDVIANALGAGMVYLLLHISRK